jgi:hypothetical protein
LVNRPIRALSYQGVSDAAIGSVTFQSDVDGIELRGQLALGFVQQAVFDSEPYALLDQGRDRRGHASSR